MSVLIVDASVGAKWFFEEEFSDFSIALLDSRHQLHAPDFFLDWTVSSANAYAGVKSRLPKANAFETRCACFQFNITL